MDGIEAIGLATVARLLWNQTRGYDLAVKAIMLEAALQNKTGAGSFIATAGGTLIAQAPEHPAYRVEVSGQALDLWLLVITEQNSGGDGVLVDVHPYPNGICVIL